MTEWFANHVLGMPELASKNGEAVDALIVYVHWLMIALFFGWLIYFGYAVWRFRASRNPKANYHGVKNHASNFIELGVVVAEAVLLVGVAIPVWARAVDHFPDAKDSTVIYVMAQQFAWNIRYAGPDGVFGKQDMKFVSDSNVFGVDPSDPNGKDDIQTLNEIHVPVGKPVVVYVSSKDVIHSFKVVAMRVSGRDSRAADSGLVHAHENRPLSGQLRAALRQRPFGHDGRLSDCGKPGGFRQVDEVQDRRGHQL